MGTSLVDMACKLLNLIHIINVTYTVQLENYLVAQGLATYW